MMKICPLCRTNAEISDGSPLEEDNTGREFVQCPVCGRYDYSKAWNELEEFNKDHLMSYLVYRPETTVITRRNLKNGVINGEKSSTMET